MRSRATDNYLDTDAAIALLRSFNVGCAPAYECANDYNSPCEIRARAFNTLSDKLCEMLLNMTYTETQRTLWELRASKPRGENE